MFTRVVIAVSLLLLYISALPTTRVQGSTSIRYVNVNIGSDWGNCTNPSTPRRTIQYAINQATHGDTVRVAAGTYTREAASDLCSIYLGYPTVVCIINKDLTLIGGYPSGNWSFSDPVAYPTIIDGQWQHRGVWVQDTEPANPPTAGITMDGFTVRHGLAAGQPSGSDAQTFAFGGGLLADHSRVTLRNMRFENNIAAGGGRYNPYGGSAAGAAVAIRKSIGTVSLERLVFRQNWSIGGPGTVRGGYAMGAGLFLLRTTTDASMLELYENASDAGNTSGNGMLSGETADAFGAITIMGYADVRLRDIIARYNRVRGGNAATHAGGGFGGAIMAEGLPTTDADGDGQLESVTLRISECELTDNLSEGGEGSNGGYAAGGAISTIHSTVFVSRCKVLRNTAQGGNGTSLQGPAGGGGVHFHNINFGTPTVYMDNSLIAHNTARAGTGGIVGGGGGGVWLQGITASLVHNTIANNCLNFPLLGSAIAVLSYGVQSGPKPAYIHYNIIANHTQTCDPNSGALFVHDNTTAHLNRNLFFNNFRNTFILNSGVIHGFDSSVFANPRFIGGAQPEHAFQITAASGAINQGYGSSATNDIAGRPRVGMPDLGAYECCSAFLPVTRR
jgi:hypothetical protein